MGYLFSNKPFSTTNKHKNCAFFDKSVKFGVHGQNHKE